MHENLYLNRVVPECQITNNVNKEIKFLGEEIAVENQRIKPAFSTAAADRIIAEHGELSSGKAYEKNFRVSLARLRSIVDAMEGVIFKEKQQVGVEETLE